MLLGNQRNSACGLRTLETRILKQNSCCGCGACILVCPNDAFVLGTNGLVYLKASYERNKCSDCKLCAQVCPSITGHLSPARIKQKLRLRSLTQDWSGRVNTTLKVRATSNCVAEHAASGGAVTTLLLCGLEHGWFDAVIVVGRDENKPWLPAPILTRDPSVVLDCAQSTYALCPNLLALRSSNSECSIRRIAFVGLPCQIRAIQNLKSIQSQLPLLLPEIVLSIGIACSSSTLLTGTESLISNVCGLPLQMVKHVKYRNGGYPGEFWVQAKDGREITVPFWQMVAYFQRFKPLRCQTCADWISCFADLSVADGSDDPFRLSLNKSHILGRSLVFIRSKRGADAMRFACGVGYLRCENTRFKTNAGLELKIKRLSALVSSMMERTDQNASCTNAFCQQWKI